MCHLYGYVDDTGLSCVSIKFKHVQIHVSNREMVKMYWKSDTIHWNIIMTTMRIQYVWISTVHVQIVKNLVIYHFFYQIFWITFIKSQSVWKYDLYLCWHITFVSRNELTFWTCLNSFLTSLLITYFLNIRFI